MRAVRRAAGRVLWTMAGLGCLGTALAGPTSVRDGAGTFWQLIADSDSGAAEGQRAGFTLQKLQPGMPADSTFGDNGGIHFAFGGAGGAVSLRVDAQGRIWISGNGNVVGAAGSDNPVVQRFTAEGQPDAAWADGGQSLATIAGERLTVTDMLPNADGSLWLAGTAVNPLGDLHGALWRLAADGSVDSGFAGAGLWQRPGPEISQVLSLAEGPGGSVGVGLLVRGGGRQWLEIYTLAAGAAVPVPMDNMPRDQEGDDSMVLTSDGGWTWTQGPETVGVTGVARPKTASPGAGTAEPEDAIASAPVDGDDDDTGGLGAALSLGLVALVIAFMVWRRRRGKR